MSCKTQTNKKDNDQKLIQSGDHPTMKKQQVAYAECENLDQPEHPPNLVSLSCQNRDSLDTLLPSKCTAQILIRPDECPG